MFGASVSARSNWSMSLVSSRTKREPLASTRISQGFRRRGSFEARPIDGDGKLRSRRIAPG